MGVIGSGLTGCRLAAASAGNAYQYANDLVREAVGYSGVLAGGYGQLFHTSLIPLLQPLTCALSS
jgi:hypothetical protein